MSKVKVWAPKSIPLEGRPPKPPTISNPPPALFVARIAISPAKLTFEKKAIELLESVCAPMPSTPWMVTAGELGSLLNLVSPLVLVIHTAPKGSARSEEHTSELQSRPHLVCRLLLEKKKISIVKYPALRS